MASVPSRPKNGTSNESMDEFARLLQSKAGLEPVTTTLHAAAEHLRDMGIISYEVRSYVRCAFTEDRDFQHSNRTCTGRVLLDDRLDENSNDYRCSQCDRPIYPSRDQKKDFKELRVKVLRKGVQRYVLDALDGWNPQPVAGVPTAWRIDAGITGVYVCLADCR